MNTDRLNRISAEIEGAVRSVADASDEERYAVLVGLAATFGSAAYGPRDTARTLHILASGLFAEAEADERRRSAH